METRVEDHRVLIVEKEKKLAKITFPMIRDGVVQIDHTYVDDSLRGQGIASKLVKIAIEHIWKQGWQFEVTCPYALSWVKHHEDYQNGWLKEETAEN